MKYLYQTRKGVALLIAIGLITVIMFFSLLISNVVVSGTRQSVNMARYDRARIASDGAMELALLAAANNEAGFNQEVETYIDCPDLQNPDPTCIKIRYKVQGQVMGSMAYSGDYDGFYSAPAPGTGTSGTDCDPLSSFYDSAFYYSPSAEPHFSKSQIDTSYIGPIDAANHPCNWNRLRVGETVAIPLYVVLSAGNVTDCTTKVTEADGTEVCNPVGLGLNELKLRVRTPCEKETGNTSSPDYCAPGDRYELFVKELPSGALHIEKDPTIVSWSIEGKSLDGLKSYYLGPVDEYDKFKKRFLYNSEIFSSRINSAANVSSDFVVLSNTDAGQNLEKSLLDEIGFFLNDSGMFSKTGSDVLNRPVLKLAVINSLSEHVSMGGEKVPYVEYQLLVDQSVMPPTSEKALITAEAVSGEHKSTMEAILPYSSGIVDYVLQQ